MDLKTVDTKKVPVRYYEAGEGEALVFLHGAGGLTATDPLLLKLAQRYHIYAPLLPGYGDSDEAPELRDMLDFTLHGWDVIEALGLKNPILVGHSMGGMIAAEMAALAPNDVSRLVLICPAGLWMDEHPLPDMFSLMPYEMPKFLFHDVEKGAAILTAGRNVSDPNFLQTYLINNARQLGMAGKILFPIPERGLAGRLYRVKAKTVIVWGESDRMVPPIYGPAFRDAITGAMLVTVPDAGHMVGLEQTDAVAGAIDKLAA